MQLRILEAKKSFNHFRGEEVSTKAIESKSRIGKGNGDELTWENEHKSKFWYGKVHGN